MTRHREYHPMIPGIGYHLNQRTLLFFSNKVTDHYFWFKILSDSIQSELVSSLSRLRDRKKCLLFFLFLIFQDSWTTAQSYCQITPLIYAGDDKSPSLLIFSAKKHMESKSARPSFALQECVGGLNRVQGEEKEEMSEIH